MMKRAKNENENLREIAGEVSETEAVVRSSDLITFNLDDDNDLHSTRAAKAA